VYTGVHDASLDAILDAAAATFEPSERGRLYKMAAKRISDQSYAPFLFAFAPTQVTVKGIEGPGVTTRIPPIFINTGVLWQDVRFIAR
jgi:peptide/nickel transport system substrate-binding protein